MAYGLAVLMAIGMAAHDGSRPERFLPSHLHGRATHAEKVNQELGIGFNLGNVFDNGQNPANLAELKQIVDVYAKAGMRHVRIPVTWGEGIKDGPVPIASADGTVNAKHPRLDVLKRIVDYALSKRLYVIVNTHHEHWLKDHYDGSAVFDEKFARLWTGIAETFKRKSDHLIFEALNEPEKAFGGWSGPVKWDDPTALAFTRKINSVALAAVRKTGRVNATRVFMVGTNGLGNQGTFRTVYPSIATIPGGGSDQNIIVTVHTYDPWAFCGENGRNTSWPGPDAITSPIRRAAEHGRSLGVPVNFGEFGVGRNEHADERNSDVVRDYYRLVTQTALAEGMSATVWDDRGWFGLVARQKQGGFEFVGRIVPSMLQKPLRP